MSKNIKILLILSIFLVVSFVGFKFVPYFLHDTAIFCDRNFVKLSYKNENYYKGEIKKDGVFKFKKGEVEFFYNQLKIGKIKTQEINEDKKVFLADILGLKRGDYLDKNLVKLTQILLSLKKVNKKDGVLELFSKDTDINEIFRELKFKKIINTNKAKAIRHIRKNYEDNNITLIIPKRNHKIIYITKNGSGIKNGKNWANAYDKSQIQKAINMHKTIWIAKGEYAPQKTLKLLDYSSIYGGFAGDEYVLEERDTDARQNSTILSGEHNKSVLKAIDLSGNIIIDGFIIANGNAPVDFYEKKGGGLMLVNSKMSIKNTTFTNNRADLGGGIYSLDSQLYLENVFFNKNEAENGGGLYNRYNYILDVKNVAFKENRAQKGGGIYNWLSYFKKGHIDNWTNKTINFEDVVFDKNIADYGGGMYNTSVINQKLKNVLLKQNRANKFGGGVYNDDGRQFVFQTIFSQNRAGENGGAIHNYESILKLKNVTLTQNETLLYGGGIYNKKYARLSTENVAFSQNKAKFGGAITDDRSSYSEINSATFSKNVAENSGGGICILDNSQTTLANTTFSKNIAKNGGGIATFNANSELTNVTFSENIAKNEGGGVYSSNSSLVVTNTILWANSSNKDKNKTEEISNKGGTLKIANSIIKQNSIKSAIYNNPKLSLKTKTVDNVEQTYYIPAEKSPAIDNGKECKLKILNSNDTAKEIAIILSNSLIKRRCKYLDKDQIQNKRKMNAIDIGAVEK